MEGGCVQLDSSKEAGPQALSNTPASSLSPFFLFVCVHVRVYICLCMCVPMTIHIHVRLHTCIYTVHRARVDFWCLLLLSALFYPFKNSLGFIKPCITNALQMDVQFRVGNIKELLCLLNWTGFFSLLKIFSYFFINFSVQH